MIHVVRHGRTEANASGLLLGRADPDLDDVGRAQAARVAGSVPADALVVSSPLSRTFQTAMALAPEDQIRVDERLIELDYGDFDLRPLSEIPAETWAAWRADPHFAPPNGESLHALGERVWAALDELAAEAVDRDVVVVTHVSPIKAAVAWALEVGMEISWRSHVAQASIARIAVSDRGRSLHAFNDVSHLADLG